MHSYTLYIKSCITLSAHHVRRHISTLTHTVSHKCRTGVMIDRLSFRAKCWHKAEDSCSGAFCNNCFGMDHASLATGASTCNRTQETSRNPTSRVSGEFAEKAWSKNMQKPIGDLSKESRYLQNAESWSNLKHKSCIVLQPSSCEALEGNCRCHPTLQVDFPGSLSACQTATTIVTSTEQQKHHQQSRQNSKNLWDVCLTWGLNYLHRWFLCSFIMFPHLQIPILALQSA